MSFESPLETHRPLPITWRRVSTRRLRCAHSKGVTGVEARKHQPPVVCPQQRSDRCGGAQAPAACGVRIAKE
eukprot:365295-Chlamydomonas_euryale.AAC.12